MRIIAPQTKNVNDSCVKHERSEAKNVEHPMTMLVVKMMASMSPSMEKPPLPQVAVPAIRKAMIAMLHGKCMKRCTMTAWAFSQ